MCRDSNIVLPLLMVGMVVSAIFLLVRFSAVEDVDRVAASSRSSADGNAVLAQIPANDSLEEGSVTAVFLPGEFPFMVAKVSVGRSPLTGAERNLSVLVAPGRMVKVGDRVVVIPQNLVNHNGPESFLYFTPGPKDTPATRPAEATP